MLPTPDFAFPSGNSTEQRNAQGLAPNQTHQTLWDLGLNVSVIEKLLRKVQCTVWIENVWVKGIEGP